MRPHRLVLTTVAVCVALTAFGWTALKAFGDTARWEDRVLAEDCDVDPTLSGFQGYCLRLVRFHAGPVSSSTVEIQIYPVNDGSNIGRYTYFPSPFRDGTAIDVDWSEVEERIVVTGPGGVEVTYPASEYGFDTYN